MYNFKKIEKKWQDIWENEKAFVCENNSDKPKYYYLIEFPYPSGAGLHVGHVRSQTALDSMARKKRMQGFNVLYPIGWDSFGLPTEQYAIKNHIHPKIATKQNIETFKRQIKSLGISFDWSREFSTTDEDYYKWTQWQFLKFFEKGMAYKAEKEINWCPNCKIGLSNEESEGNVCERCGGKVEKKLKSQWMLKMSLYADKLLDGLKEVDYLPNIKLQQENWIGKSTGAFVDFKLKEVDETLRIYTTRCDTLFGVTFMVIAPEHPIITKYKDRISNINTVKEYQEKASKKTEFERTQLIKDKTGVKIEGITAINPVNKKEIPIYISDYVMMNYGTGAIMAVPAHDMRDYEFAQKFNIDIIPVIKGDTKDGAYIGDGIHINSEFLNNLNKEEAIEKMLLYLKENGIGEKGVQYKMKDWAFNRQRYWGEPIPIIYCNKCGTVPVPYEQLPLKLPNITNFEPGTNGESPLAKISEFVNCKCPKCGSDAKRETDTMPQWAGSSWYYLRYIDPLNDKCFADYDKLKYWLPVDWYNGGMEHVTRHLIYSRFWHKFLYDLNVVPTKEPYKRRTAQGLILGPDGEKMSKSRGNVIDPLDIIEEYGADTLRTYVLFMGDYSVECPWNEDAIKGVFRFLDRVYNLKNRVKEDNNYTKSLEIIINKTIKKVSNDIENMKFNTAIAELMKLINTYYELENITTKDYETLIKLLYPFAPHITEELNKEVLNKDSLVYSSYPTYEEEKTKEDTFEMIIQVNGKLRDKIITKTDITEEEMKSLALNSETIKKYTLDKQIIKIIVVKGKLINIVVN